MASESRIEIHTLDKPEQGYFPLAAHPACPERCTGAYAAGLCTGADALHFCSGIVHRCICTGMVYWARALELCTSACSLTLSTGPGFVHGDLCTQGTWAHALDLIASMLIALPVCRSQRRSSNSISLLQKGKLRHGNLPKVTQQLSGKAKPGL